MRVKTSWPWFFLLMAVGVFRFRGRSVLRAFAAGESPLPFAWATMACSASLGMPSSLRSALAVQHFLAERLEVYVEFLGLRQHLVFFFLDMMPHAFRKDREFGHAMVAASAR